MAIMPKIRISGPLAPYVGGAWSYLLAQGYTPLVSQCKLRLASQLSRWLVDAGVRLSALTREHVEAFFGERRQAGYRSNVTPRSLSSILRYLEEKGVVSLLEAVVQRSAVDDLLDEYEQFLVKERGLQASTVRSYYRSYAKKFLSHRFDSNSLELSCLSANDITGFILQESETSSVAPQNFWSPWCVHYFASCTFAAISKAIWWVLYLQSRVGGKRVYPNSFRLRGFSSF